MKALRWTAASVVWLLGGLLGLLGAILCVTLILAPLGIPLLFLARRLFKTAGQLVVPRAVRHPIDTLGQRASDAGDDARKRGGKVGKQAGKKAGKATDRAGKKAGQASERAGKKAGKAGKKVRKNTGSASKRLKRKLPTS